MPNNSTDKPAKPYPDYPLYPHPSGRWAKTINGRKEYFGTWGDGWKKALDNYLSWKDDLYADRRPVKEGHGKLTVRDLCNSFRAANTSKVLTGELAQRSLNDYLLSIQRIIKVFGKTVPVEHLVPDDFARLKAEIATRYHTPEGLGNEINRCRVIFNHATKNHLVSQVKFGEQFKRPRQSVIRKARAQKRLIGGTMSFSAEEIRKLTEASCSQLKAMTLLGINAGLDNVSIGQLPIGSLHLEDAWLDFPRYKHGADRQCPLWPETVEAIREFLKERPTPRPGNEHFAFLTRCGTSWDKGKSSPLSHEYCKIMNDAGVYRKGRGFRALRHTFETIAGGSRDQVAVDHIMGHEAPTMAAVYREQIGRERLQAVVDYVHNWLWPSE